MRSFRWKLLTAIVMVAGFAVAWYVAVPKPVAASLEAALIEPVAGEDGSVEWTSRLPVVARWTLTNHGTEPVKNAVIGANCQCHVLAGLPESLAPGESVEVSLKITPPPAGTAVRDVPVLVKGRADPVAVLPLRLRVPVQAPQWLVGPSPVTIRTVVGQDHCREVVLDSIEHAATDPRLIGISIANERICGAVLTPEQRPWGDDGQYVLRKYRITLTPGVTTAGKHHTEIALAWSDGSPARHLPVTIEAMPSLLVTPSELSLLPAGSRRLTIVPRVAHGGQITTESDSRLIRLRTVTHPSGVLTVDVEQVADVGDSGETQIVVRCKNADPVRVRVWLAAGNTPAATGNESNDDSSTDKSSEAG